MLVLNAIRALLRRLFLRGALLDWWTRNRSKNVEQAYLRELIHHANSFEVAPLPPRIGSGKQIRSILFIADCYWELDELVPELERIAHVTVADVHAAIHRKPPGARNAELVLQNIREIPASVGPDVILLYNRPSLMSQELFKHLRKTWRCPVVGMNLDDKAQFFPYRIFKSGNDGYSDWCREFDVNLTSSRAAVDWYAKLGANVRYVPMGFRQREGFATPPTDISFKHRMSFVGSWKPERAALIEDLQRYGIPIEVFGSGWRKSRRIDTPAKVYRASQMNLGIGFALASTGVVSHKARDFECPGAGACYLTTFNWELAGLYDIGKEILCYRSIEELVELYSFYVKRPDQCLRIAKAAHRRCAAEHTWERRFRDVFSDLGFIT